MPKTAPKIDFDLLRQKLKVGTLQLKADLVAKHSDIKADLLNKAVEVTKLRQQSAQLLGTSALAGTFLLAPVNNTHLLATPDEIIQKVKQQNINAPIIAPQKVLIESLKEILPDKPRPLTRNEEKVLEKVFEETLHVPAKATLEGEHLNTTYGFIGAEQHLVRFPGDTMALQVGDNKSLWKEGMAPGKGAWGYFASSKSQLTPQLVETEKWYAVVQTLYLPDWNTRTRYLRDWYKYRKVVIVNTINGNAVIASIADSGPAAWTGKHFGGSPEVMMHLGGPRYKKGAVVLFFVDDPENKIPLGPVEYNKIQAPQWAFHQI